MRLLKLVPDNTNFDFMKWRNIALILSIIVTLASIALVGVRGLNLGVDFVGGQMIRVSFEQPAPVEDIRSTVAGLNMGDASIQEFGNPRTLSIRMGLPEGGDQAAVAAASRVRNAISAKYPKAQFAVDSVSGKVSNELYKAGAIAIALAMLGIAIYIWLRFEWQFGVGALVTLFHDVCMTVGFFSLTQLEFNLNVVAAILTIVGYSLNDTVVIYDRIRENLRKYRKMDIVSLLNLSMNETLSRTVATNFAMLLALGSLMLLGPAIIQSFTTALLISVIVGTYSTVYIAAPWLVWLKVDSDSFLPKTNTTTSGGERVTSHNEGY
ncbi:MAG TPA: protein translocase subunit SecF, partial [Allosphingosinicella sp.]